MTWFHCRIMWLRFFSFHSFYWFRLLLILFLSYKMELTSVHKCSFGLKDLVRHLRHFSKLIYTLDIISLILIYSKILKKVSKTCPIGRQPTFKFILEQYCVTQKILTVASSFFDKLSRDDRSITGRISGEKIQKKTFLNSKLRLEFRRSDRKLI